MRKVEDMSDLIIVESPSKAKTLKNYLGKGYNIVAFRLLV